MPQQTDSRRLSKQAQRGARKFETFRPKSPFLESSRLLKHGHRADDGAGGSPK
jgi:hypothetical protein